MELRHLRSAEAVARTLNFTRAAKLMGLTQPSLSVQIQQLETELGVRLFERSRRKLSVTPAGQRFLAAAARSLRDLEAATREIQDAATGRSGHVRLRVAEDAWSRPLEKMLRRFLRKHRGVHLRLVTGLEPWDVCVETHPAPHAEGHLLHRSSIGVAMSPKHRLARKDSLDAADLLGETILLSKPRSAAEQWILSSEIPIDPVETESGRSQLLRMASIGLGLALCGSHEASGMGAEVRSLESIDYQVDTVISIHPDSQSPAAQVLLEVFTAPDPAPPTP